MEKSVNIKWDLLGAELASLSNFEQGLFFQGFARELNNFESHYVKEMQMMYIGDKLQDKDKQILKDYLPSIWYKDE